MAGFGERLRALREEKNMKQEDMAKIFGISRGAISKYENNEREPSIKLIEAFADYFGVTVDYIFGRTDIRNGADNSTEESGMVQNDAISPEQEKLERLMKNEAFIRLAVKIEENGLDVEEVGNLIDSVVTIRNKAQKP